MKIIELHREHCKLHGENAVVYNTFNARINRGVMNIQECVEKPKQTKEEITKKVLDLYKKHTNKHGNKSCKLSTFKSRRYSQGRSREKAIELPYQGLGGDRYSVYKV